MRSNVPLYEQHETEMKFRKLFMMFFKARGDSERRHRLVRLMRAVRDRLCVSWETFVDWFQSTLSVFSAVEHNEVMATFMPKYIQAIALEESQRYGRPMSTLFH